ncbi:hypothetical protein Pla108_38810 [Botrimarina colliarenosi]|uniref:PEP-CTERM protein-sorting domain-containing protein n=1 Tax=Botrimarina colliarenosi TaxID=2528001 RepID=A0A5C6A268_9BACT|nr:hypothetical protein [Botrimarina colliarenosi]TWT93387.1 hypothetical protein Pla108_38810 [Botrimarina colliarenosi]
MKIGPLCALALATTWLTAPALAVTTVLIDDDFESYADTSALNAVWAAAGANGQLVDETFTEFITADDLDPQAVGARAYPTGGQGVEHRGGGVVQIDLASLNGGNPISPSATQTIVVEGDMFDIGGFGNKRMSIGLRSTSPQNLIELGQYNEDPIGYANRTILFPAAEGDEANPNWQYFELPIELDRADDLDEVVTIGDIGEAWATYRAIITPTTITYEMDLYRDGVINDGTDTPGVDATVTYNITTGSNGYNSLRMGGPSGIASGGNGFYGGMIFDNLKLSLVEVDAVLTGDYNGDGMVNAADYTVWRDTLGSTEDLRADGNGNLIIDGPSGMGSDYDLWASNYGAVATATASAVPEPVTAFLALFGIAAAATRRN